MQGKIIFEGPSLIDGKPIVAIATISLTNQKVGYNLATYILRSDISPVEAVRTREDVSICGGCVHRGVSPSTRSCYVHVGFRGPMVVWEAYKRGTYGKEVTDPRKLPREFLVRLGTYGDINAVPREVWDRLIDGNKVGHTGYTHSPTIQDTRNLVQASADTVEQALHLQEQGWKTFRVRKAGEPLLDNERQCPAAVEAGKKVTCSQCRLCNGKKANISVEIHGAANLRKNFVLNLER